MSPFNYDDSTRRPAATTTMLRDMVDTRARNRFYFNDDDLTSKLSSP